MKRQMDFQAESFIRERKRHTRLRRAIALLCAVVMLLTMNSLKMNADTLEHIPGCGLEEHRHTLACYPLVCPLAEAEPQYEIRRAFTGDVRPHVHSEDCYDDSGNLACGYVESLYYHVHNRWCYDDGGNLVCGLSEIQPHVHTEACYQDVPTLICGQDEYPAHHHTQDCYFTVRELACGLEENPGHIHTAECYYDHNELTCGLEESVGHIHTTDCYIPVVETTCGMEEGPGHIHTAECFTRELVCGELESEAHQHTDACYADVLTCEIPEGYGAHTHSESCYTVYNILVCGIPEGEGAHTHTKDCVTSYHTLVCGIPEGEGAHTHTDNCYVNYDYLVCGQEETEGHTHTDACYEHTSELICGEQDGSEWVAMMLGQEGVQVHAHTAECFTTFTRTLENGEERTLRFATCGYQEIPTITCQESDWTSYPVLVSEGHAHTDACYDLTAEPICGMVEHEHTDACYQTRPVKAGATPAEGGNGDANSADLADLMEDTGSENGENETDGQSDDPSAETNADGDLDEVENATQVDNDENEAENQEQTEVGNEDSADLDALTGDTAEGGLSDAENGDVIDANTPAEGALIDEPADGEPSDIEAADVDEAANIDTAEGELTDGTADGEPSDTEAADADEAADTDGAEGELTDGTADGEPSDTEAAEGEPTDGESGEPADGEPTDGTADGEPSDTEAADGEPTDGEPTDEESNETADKESGESSDEESDEPTEGETTDEESGEPTEGETTDEESDETADGEPTGEESDEPTDEESDETANGEPTDKTTDEESGEPTDEESGETTNEESDETADGERTDEESDEIADGESADGETTDEESDETADGETTDEESDEPAEFTAGERVIEVKDGSVTLVWGPEAEIPGDVRVEVIEIERGTTDYDILYNNAMAALSEKKDTETTTQVMRFFDITLYAGEDTIEPKAAISVTVQVNEAEATDNDADVDAVHMEDVGAQATVVEATTDSDTVSFEAESFSIYGVVVDVPATEAEEPPVSVAVDLSSVDLMAAAEVTDTVSLSIPDLLAGADESAVQVEGDLSVEPEALLEGAEITASEGVQVDGDRLVLPTDALESGAVSLEMTTYATNDDYETVATTHKVDIELTGYQGRTDVVEGDGVTVKALEGNSLPADAVATAQQVEPTDAALEPAAGEAGNSDAAAADEAADDADAPEASQSEEGSTREAGDGAPEASDTAAETTDDTSDADIADDADAVDAPSDESTEGFSDDESNEADASDHTNATAETVTDTISGAVAYDITISNANEDVISETGRVEVVLEPENLNIYEGLPANAVVTGVSYTLIHEHEGEVSELPVDVEVDPDGTVTKITFETDKFSTSTLHYTVDFYFEVDGKAYAFSIVGGGYVSFAAMAEALHLAGQDAEASGQLEQEADLESLENGDIYDINNIEISDRTWQFVADVASLEFSSPELVWVGKAGDATTVGAMKEANGLQIQYTAEMTEEKIAEIDAKAVEAGDWALISLLPFTSEETLTVTMKNGDQYVITVTDGQLHKYVISDAGDLYEVIVTYDDTAEIPDDAELEVTQIIADTDRYAENVEKVNQELIARGESTGFVPVQFSINIISNGEVIEPKPGSVVNVEIRLAQSMFETERTEEETEESAEGAEEPAEGTEEEAAEPEALPFDGQPTLMFNGQTITVDETEGNGEISEFGVAHIADDGTVEIIGEPQTSLEDDVRVVQFETDSFSDYMVTGWVHDSGSFWNAINGLPDTFYVGDEIYMYYAADLWAYGIGTTVSEFTYEVGDPNNRLFKVVTATAPGTFRLYLKDHWDTGKNFTVKAASEKPTGNPPRALTAADGIVNNSDIGLTLNLFDYDLDGVLDNRFNNYDYDHNNGSYFKGQQTDLVSKYFLNYGINDHPLKFWGSGNWDNPNTYINQYVEHGVSSIVDSSLDGNGYPMLKNGNNRNLDYLFTLNNDGKNKAAYANVNGLFKKEGNYYVYNSDKNYAYYDKDHNEFIVYDGTYNKVDDGQGEGGSTLRNYPIGFFPFHPWTDGYDRYVRWNKSLKHHFGMSMNVDFALPPDPKAVKDLNGDDIIFEFSGDDDMWVFIDGKLAMDIGGLHQPTRGIINFTQKKVIVNGQEQSYNFPNSLYDGKAHTLKVFYIERGGCDSNCMIKFNITQYGDIVFTKRSSEKALQKGIPLEGAKFGLYRDRACTQPLMELLNDGTSRPFVAESGEDGRVAFTGIPVGIYYLMEISPPEGSPADLTVREIEVKSKGGIETEIRIDREIRNSGEYGINIFNDKPEPIDLTLVKVWQDTAGNNIDNTDGMTATFALKRTRSYVDFQQTTTYDNGKPVITHSFEMKPDGVDPTYSQQITLPEEGAWEHQFTNLPLVEKVDDKVYSYKYYVEELSRTPSGGSVIYMSTTRGDSQYYTAQDVNTNSDHTTETVYNRIPLVDIEATKTWMSSNGVDITEKITNAAVTFELQRSLDGGMTWEKVTKNAFKAFKENENPVTISVADVALAASQWKATWSDLLKSDNIEYRVVETCARAGGTVLVNIEQEGSEPVTSDVVFDNGTGTANIINTLPPTQIAVQKLWAGYANGQGPTGAWVKVALYSSSVAPGTAQEPDDPDNPDDPDEPVEPATYTVGVSVSGNPYGGYVTAEFQSDDGTDDVTLTLNSGNSWSQTATLTEGKTYTATFDVDDEVITDVSATGTTTGITLSNHTNITLTPTVTPRTYNVNISVNGTPSGGSVTAEFQPSDNSGNVSVELNSANSWTASATLTEGKTYTATFTAGTGIDSVSVASGTTNNITSAGNIILNVTETAQQTSDTTAKVKISGFTIEDSSKATQFGLNLTFTKGYQAGVSTHLQYSLSNVNLDNHSQTADVQLKGTDNNNLAYTVSFNTWNENSSYSLKVVTKNGKILINGGAVQNTFIPSVDSGELYIYYGSSSWLASQGPSASAISPFQLASNLLFPVAYADDADILPDVQIIPAGEDAPPLGIHPVDGYEEITLDGTVDADETAAWYHQWTDLPTHDAEGNEIHYYVVETAVNGINSQNVTATYDYTSDGDGYPLVKITNTPRGALTVTKAVTVNGQPTTGTLADGTYSFTITGPENYSNTGTITVSGGSATNSIVLTDLTPGEYIVIEDTPTNGTRQTVPNSGGYTLNVEPNSVASQNVAAFTNNIDTGNLSLTKTTSGKPQTDTTTAFSFEIQLTAPTGVTLASSYPATHTGDNSVQSVMVSGGKITGIQLKHSETITISGLPAGTTYAITESQDMPTGYRQGETSHLEGTIPANSAEHKVQTIAARVENVFTAEGKKNFYADKTFINGTLGNPAFTFTLTQIEAYPFDGDAAVQATTNVKLRNPREATTTVTEGNQQKVGFGDDIEFDQTDIGKTFYFMIEESVPELDANNIYNHVKYDTSKHYFTVTVGEANGELTFTRTHSVVDDDEDTAKFTNEQLGKLIVTKTFDGSAASDLTKAEKEQITFSIDGPDGFTDIENRPLSHESFVLADGVYTLTLDNIPLGEYTVTESNTAIGNYKVTSAVMVDEGASTAATTGTVELTAADIDHEVAFTNTYRKAELIVTKTIAGIAEADLSRALEGITFDIVDVTANIDDKDKTPTIEDVTISAEDLKEGSYVKTFTSAANGIKPDHTYSVTETVTAPEGYTLKSRTYQVTAGTAAQDNDGQTTTGALTLTDADPSTGKIDFTNTYTKDTSYAPKVVKALVWKGTETPVDTSKWPEEGFTFTLSLESAKDGEENIDFEYTPTSKTIKSNTPELTGIFEGIAFTKPGDYTFTITETVPKDAVQGEDGLWKLNGITYNANPVTVVVTVTEDEQTHALSAAPVYSQASISGDAGLITNTYDTTSTQTPLEVTKSLLWEDTHAAVPDAKWPTDGFEFKLTYVSGVDEQNVAFENITAAGVTLPDETTANAYVTAKVADFGKIHFTKAGTFTFTITETVPEGATEGKLNGITYDGTPKTVTVTVTDNKGTLVASVNYGTTEDPAESLTVTNTYDTTDTHYTPKADKVLKVGQQDAPATRWPTEGFTFTLAAVGGIAEDRTTPIAQADVPMPEGVTATIKYTTGTEGELEKVTNPNFGEIKYTVAGTYNYTITEKVPDDAVDKRKDGITYDDTPIAVQVVVEDVNGELTVTSVTYGEDETPSVGDAIETATATVVNTIETTDFKFNKKWFGPSGEVNGWPTGVESIEVNIGRQLKYLDSEMQTSAYLVESTFSMQYTLTKETGTGEGLPALTVTAKDNIYHYELSGLDKYGALNGNQGEWEYFVSESALSNYYTRYAKSDEEVAPIGVRESAENGGTIENHIVPATLPATGGMGTTTIYIAGASLLMLAVLGFIWLNRKRDDGTGI